MTQNNREIAQGWEVGSAQNNREIAQGWEVGSALGTYLEALRLHGTEGVEAKLKEIREKTFARMRNHKNQSISYEEILKCIAEGNNLTQDERISREHEVGIHQSDVKYASNPEVAKQRNLERCVHCREEIPA